METQTQLFMYPMVLLGLWAIPLLALWWAWTYRHRTHAIKRFLDAEMFARLSPRTGSWRVLTQSILLILALSLLIIASARPRWGMREELIFQKGRDIMIVLDVSRSMLAKDVRPNRLQRAKTDLMDLIHRLDGDRAGLIAFRNSAEVLCPLTTDYAYLEQVLNAAYIDSAKRGETDIGLAVSTALDNFDSESGSHKAIMLVSDGEDLGENVLVAAERAKEAGVRIFTVGLGSLEGATIPGFNTASAQQLNEAGGVVTTRLDRETLTQLATMTGGVYVQAETDAVNLGHVYKSIQKEVLAQDFNETLKRAHVERYQVFLLPAVLFLILTTLLSKGRLSGIKAPRSAASLIAGAVIYLLASPLNAAPAFSHGARARQAQTLFESGDFAGAASAYAEAAAESDPKVRTVYQFNEAISLYRAGQAKQASDRFRDLLSTPSATSDGIRANFARSLYETSLSATNMVMREKLLDEAGEEFLESLRELQTDDTRRSGVSQILTELPSIRRHIELEKIMEEHKDAQPFALVDDLLTSQRKLRTDIPLAFNDTTPKKIARLEKLGEEQRKNADLFLPLQAALQKSLQSAPPEKQASAAKQLSEIQSFLKTTAQTISQSSSELRNLDAHSYENTLEAEANMYQFWKMLAPYDRLIREDLLQTTNLINISTTVLARVSADHLKVISDKQAESLAISELFVKNFTQSVPEEGLPAQPDPNASKSPTNAPPEMAITPETRQKILTLSNSLVTRQTTALDSIDRKNFDLTVEEQMRSKRLIEEIISLLPNPPSSDQNNQDQDSEKPPPDGEPPPGDPQDSNSDPSKENPPEPPPESDPSKNPDPDPADGTEDDPQDGDSEDSADPDTMNKADAQRILKLASQREKEHADDVRKQKMKLEQLPIGRDQ